MPFGYDGLKAPKQQRDEMMNKSYVIGVDYGSDSVRSVIVRTDNGEEIASSVHYYVRWKEGLYCDPSTNQFRQHPLDYVEGLELTITAALRKAGGQVAQNIIAIGIDTTGSTPVAVDQSGQPLALMTPFSENPNAMFVLWKDHTAISEAAEINKHSKSFDTDYLQYVGGVYSSEWFWAKLLHILRTDQQVRNACASWVEHCDWIPFLLTGGTDISQMKRSVCAAGHKALWADAFGGYPPNDFFSALDPMLEGYVNTLGKNTYTSDKSAGTLCEEWAERLGLSEQVVVAVGAFDAHMGAVGGQIEPFHLSKVMGTSTCDIMVASTQDIDGRTVPGICGQVHGSVIPGMIGLEAGQSAFGDSYAWFRDMLLKPVGELIHASDKIDDETAAALMEEIKDKLITHLSIQAADLPFKDDDELAIDWLNGRRTPDANQYLKGSLHGLDLGSDAARIFRSIVEATCFGAKEIIDRFNDEGVTVKGLVGLGGVARKSPYIMQTLSDVTNLPIRIHSSEQTCAIGAAMFAATAAGIFTKVEDAMIHMGRGFDVTYQPDGTRSGHYKMRYGKYKVAGKFTEQHTPVQ
jgi:L-ribulokinase